jgi:hypothetical protein
VSGYVWKLMRESTGLSQFQLAEDLGVDVTTVQGWESGRRPLPAVSSGDMARYRLRLIHAGVPPRMFYVLADAFEADVVLDEAIGSGASLGTPGHHPLSATVHRRGLTNLITWPITGVMPAQLDAIGTPVRSRRGPTPGHPTLGADERARLFEHLRSVADSCRTDGDALLRRQAIYLMGFDSDEATGHWLGCEHTRAVRQAGRVDDIPSWVSVRSSAIGLTHAGDRDALHAFISAGLRDERQQLANLNYWAYWLGETDEIHVDDTFMRDSAAPWHGARLLAHLTERLQPDAAQFDLYVHTLWELLLARPRVLDGQPAVRSGVAARVAEAADSAELSSRARRELSDVSYAIRMG